MSDDAGATAERRPGATEAPTERYELPEIIPALGRFRDGIESYRRRDFGGALAAFGEVARLHPRDRLARLYLERCKALQATPPPDDWDGVWRLQSK